MDSDPDEAMVFQLLEELQSLVMRRGIAIETVNFNPEKSPYRAHLMIVPTIKEEGAMRNWSIGQIVNHPYHGPIKILAIAGDAEMGLNFKVEKQSSCNLPAPIWWISLHNLLMQMPK